MKPAAQSTGRVFSRGTSDSDGRRKLRKWHGRPYYGDRIFILRLGSRDLNFGLIARKSLDGVCEINTDR